MDFSVQLFYTSASESVGYFLMVSLFVYILILFKYHFPDFICLSVFSCTSLSFFKMMIFIFFVRPFIDLHFFTVCYWRFILFLWQCHISLILCISYKLWIWFLYIWRNSHFFQSLWIGIGWERLASISPTRNLLGVSKIFLWMCVFHSFPSLLGENSQDSILSPNPSELFSVLRATHPFSLGQCTEMPGC